MFPRMSKAILAATAAATIAVLAPAPPAHADPVSDYAADNAYAVCATLDTYPTFVA